MAYFRYQVPSLSGVTIPPAMASFQDGHYQRNGLRGVAESKRRLSGFAVASMLAVGVGLFVLWSDD